MHLATCRPPTCQSSERGGGGVGKMLLSHVTRVASGFRRVCPDQREMRERETGPLGFSWYTCFLIREMESGQRSRAVCTYQLDQE